MNVERMGAFVEYCVKPITDDVREILERGERLGLFSDPAVIKKAVLLLGVAHFLSELIRAGTYIVITWLICEAALKIL